MGEHDRQGRIQPVPVSRAEALLMRSHLPYTDN
jgi:hypothetical protein